MGRSRAGRSRVRRAVSTLRGLAASFCLGVFVVGWSAPALAAPTPVCTVSDERLPEISGLVAVDDGYAVITDSDIDTTAMRIYRLDRACKVVEGETLTLDRKPRDPEDLTRTADGTYWVADTGDTTSAPSRATVAVHVFPPSGPPSIHRMRYPDGPKDAEAMFVQTSNVPVIVSKDPSGTAKVYVSTRPITGPENAAADAVPLRAAGTIRFAATGSANPLGTIGQVVVTGAATSPDGKRVVLRTYSDAYEWDVPDGNIAKAITTTKPRRTSLASPNGLGEAIAFSPDGRTYLTLTEGDSVPLQRWTPARPAASLTSDRATADDDSGFSLRQISLTQFTLLVLGIGVVGLGLLVAGVIGILRFRKRPGGGRPPGSGPRTDLPRPPESGGAGDETMALPRVAGAAYGSGPDERGEDDRPAEPPREALPGRPVGTTYGPGGTRATPAESAARAVPPVPPVLSVKSDPPPSDARRAGLSAADTQGRPAGRERRGGDRPRPERPIFPERPVFPDRPGRRGPEGGSAAFGSPPGSAPGFAGSGGQAVRPGPDRTGAPPALPHRPSARRPGDRLPGATYGRRDLPPDVPPGALESQTARRPDDAGRRPPLRRPSEPAPGGPGPTGLAPDDDGWRGRDR